MNIVQRGIAALHSLQAGGLPEDSTPKVHGNPLGRLHTHGHAEKRYRIDPEFGSDLLLVGSSKLADKAEELLHKELDERGLRPQDMYAVFDVDDTLVTTDFEKDVGAPFSVKEMQDITGDSAAIKATRQMLHRLSSLGVRIIVLTARVSTPEFFDYTKAQLNAIGVVPRKKDKHGIGYEMLILTPEHLREPSGDIEADIKSVATFKADVRAMLGERKPVVFTVGDQWTDMGMDMDGAPKGAKKVKASVGRGVSIHSIGDDSGVFGVKLPA